MFSHIDFVSWDCQIDLLIISLFLRSPRILHIQSCHLQKENFISPFLDFCPSVLLPYCAGLKCSGDSGHLALVWARDSVPCCMSDVSGRGLGRTPSSD